MKLCWRITGSLVLKKLLPLNFGFLNTNWTKSWSRQEMHLYVFAWALHFSPESVFLDGEVIFPITTNTLLF